MDSKKNKDKVYYHQALLLIIIYRMIIGLTYLPILNTTPANQDSWIVLLLSIPYTIILCLSLLYLGNKFNHLNLLEYTEKIMGKFLGKVLGIFYIIVFLIYLIFFSSAFVEILDSSLYRQTPTIVNISILLITSIYLASKGLTNIARLGELVIPFVLFVFFLLAILGLENYDFSVFLPILSDSTFKEINTGAITISLRYVDVLVLAMFIPNLEVKKDANKVFFKSLIYSIIIIALSAVIVQATLGIEYAKRINFPYYNYARLITIGDTQGFDLLYILIWIMGYILKISGYLYFITVGLENVTNKRKQTFIIPVSIVVMIAVLLIKDRTPVIAVREPFQQILMITSIISIIIIPLIILIVYFFRRKELDNNKSTRQ